MNCVFCDIVKGRVPCHKIWENDEHLVFLSIFPNTKGFSVVITKEHFSSYAFGQEDQILTKLILAKFYSLKKISSSSNPKVLSRM